MANNLRGAGCLWQWSADPASVVGMQRRSHPAPGLRPASETAGGQLSMPRRPGKGAPAAPLPTAG